MARKKRFNRSAEDLGNIVELEHVNVTIPDQRLATLFYVAGLGLTRDPFQMTSVTNMWVTLVIWKGRGVFKNQFFQFSTSLRESTIGSAIRLPWTVVLAQHV